MVNTLLGKGAVDETHPLHLGMLGMHGTAYANKAVVDCDLIMAIGARWDDRITGKRRRVLHATRCKIHIDIDPAEFNKMIRPDVALRRRRAARDRGPGPAGRDGATPRTWLDAVRRAGGSSIPLKYPKQGGLRAQHVLDRLNALTEGEAIITTDVGQHQMWAAQFCLTTQQPPLAQLSGGAGTMGFGFPAAIGAQFGAPEARGLGDRRRRRLPDDAVRARDRGSPQARRSSA